MSLATGSQFSTNPKRIAEKGAPDFKITKSALILGYVENKAIGENLDKVLKSDQIKRYKSLSQNIIVTDYLHFIWINKDGIQRETLCHATDLESPKFRLREDRVAAVSGLLEGFFSTAPEGIGRSEQLALALATRSKLLRDYLGEELVRQEREHKEGRLYGLFQIFRDQVFHELTLREFADAFAQMLAYGLFLARLNSVSQPITLHNAREYVPGSFRLIRELVDFLTELEKDEYRDVRWVVEEVLSIVNGLDLPAIHEDLSFRKRKAISRRVRAVDEEEHRLFERDPFIYYKAATRYDISYSFPIRVNEKENLSSVFRAFLDARYEHHYTPEEVVGYLYAVLYAPTYRMRYDEFLHIDFPRVPFPEAADNFERLSRLGWALVQAHLLRELPREGLAAYQGKGDHRVESVHYLPDEKVVSINKTQFFKPVPQDVWNFRIGGYQVLDKYLKSRKGRALSLDEINHVGAIADSLAFTIEQMAKIDEAYKAAFAERG
jgi:hypothetical protein